MSSTASSSQPPPAQSSSSSSKYTPPTQQQIEECTRRTRDQLRQLRLDDMASLAQEQQIKFGNPIIDEHISWINMSLVNLVHYGNYLLTTWGDIIINTFNAHLDLGDRLSMFYFASGASIVLLVIYIWCLISTNPFLVWLYRLTFGRGSGGLGLVNAMNPKLFENLTIQQATAAKEKLSAVPNPAQYQSRVFDLDIAKMLLQISSLMYERDNADTVKAVKHIQSQLATAQNVSATTYTQTVNGLPLLSDLASTGRAAVERPGNLFNTLVGHKNIGSIADSVLAIEHESRKTVDKWANFHKVQYEPVSELASLSQAYVSVFWDPTSNWIVVAFKGTDPRSFEEWTTDFTASFENAHDDIPGFKFIHRDFKGGFKERIFPSKLGTNQRPPWTSISGAIKIVADNLATIQAPGTKINLWFTGHSLGTALATLAYSKALVDEAKLPPNVVLRDAYLFATPITVDLATRNAFDEKVYKKGTSGIVRTMWRVTNRNDFVATGLPAFGDSDKYDYDPNNLFGFSHLGIEIFMKSGPQPCQIQGNRVKILNSNFDVHIASRFTPDEVIAQRELAVKDKLTLRKAYGALQMIPLVGRLAAHATVNYYDQLDQIALLQCVDRA